MNKMINSKKFKWEYENPATLAECARTLEQIQECLDTALKHDLMKGYSEEVEAFESMSIETSRLIDVLKHNTDATPEVETDRRYASSRLAIFSNYFSLISSHQIFKETDIAESARMVEAVSFMNKIKDTLSKRYVWGL